MSEPWIEWKGGPCPVSELAIVEVASRNGNRTIGHAGSYRWDHRDSPEDVWTYRLSDVLPAHLQRVVNEFGQVHVGGVLRQTPGQFVVGRAVLPVGEQTPPRSRTEIMQRNLTTFEDFFDKIEGLEVDLNSALGVLWRRGDDVAREWVRANYPAAAKKLETNLKNESGQTIRPESKAEVQSDFDAAHLTERLIRAILVYGFENDASAEAVLRGQSREICGMIERAFKLSRVPA